MPQTLEPSPKFTQVFEIASSSVAVKATDTVVPSTAVDGAVIVTEGAASVMEIEAVFEPVRAEASVALTVIVKLPSA